MGTCDHEDPMTESVGYGDELFESLPDHLRSECGEVLSGLYLKVKTDLIMRSKLVCQ